MKSIFIMTMSNLLSTNVVVSILVSVYDKHGVDYTTVRYMIHVKYKLQTTLPKLMVPFLIAGHIL